MRMNSVYAIYQLKLKPVLICVFTLALPALLAHSSLIEIQAMIMSIIGGLLIYGTIISFTMFFQEEQDF